MAADRVSGTVAFDTTLFPKFGLPDSPANVTS